MRTLSRLQALQRKVGAAARVRSTEPPASLQDFIAQSPNRDAPHHLKPLTDLFEQIRAGGQVNALLSVPPQHGKSETVLHGLVWLMLAQPEKRHAYASYAQSFTRDQVIIANRVAEQHNLPRDRSTLDRWGTPEGGGVTWTSRGGPLTGRPVDGLLLIDDLLKDRLEANSALIRRRAMDWLSATAFTRRHPSASTLVIATRWHLDDPTGQLARTAGWEIINLPAINPDGTALWPEARPLDWLQEQRAAMLPADWHALYMGEPRPLDSQPFNGEPSWYDTLPTGTYREAVGVDFAYTAKSHADYSVAIEGRAYDDQIYITRMYRAQIEAPAFAEILKTWGTSHILARIGGTEKGIVQFIRKTQGLKMDTIPATTDKFAFAQPVAAAWNAGKVHPPKNQPWTRDFIDELQSFSGISDAHDDIVDALGALHHALVIKPRANLEQLRKRSGL